MGCCGGNRNVAIPEPPQAPTLPLSALSSEGMMLVRFLGGNVGSMQWNGAPSGRVYVFGNNDRDRVKYVEQRDVAWFLAIVEGDQAQFAEYDSLEVF